MIPGREQGLHAERRASAFLSHVCQAGRSGPSVGPQQKQGKPTLWPAGKDSPTEASGAPDGDLHKDGPQPHEMSCVSNNGGFRWKEQGNSSRLGPSDTKKEQQNS